MKVVRTFHPVGQGAFYTEEFYSNERGGAVKTIVYDCGSNSLKRLKNEITTYFPKGRVIDILFISHLDIDHINGIPELKKHCRIKKVILPLLWEEEKIVLRVNCLTKYSVRGRNYELLNSLIDDPLTFFNSEDKEDETLVFFVNPSQKGGKTTEDDQSRDNLNNKNVIQSGTRLSISIADWVYIPYNFEYESRRCTLRKKLNEIFNDNEFTNPKLFEDKEQLRILKGTFQELPGGTNENSLIVYSGTINDVEHTISSSSNCFKELCSCSQIALDFRDNKGGCLYLGDSNLNLIGEDIKTILQDYHVSIGLIQIPHHGAVANFNISFLSIFEENKTFVLSCGLNNSYGHPSLNVVKECSTQNRILSIVNECPGSKCVHEIDF